MESKSYQRILFCLLFFSIGLNGLFAQSIGPETGQTYLTFGWYYQYDGTESTEYSAILYSKDYGRTFEVLDTIVIINPEYFFDAGWVFADAAPGILYRATEEGFYRSIDHANTWEFLYEFPPFYGHATGNVENEIFRTTGGVLYKSTDNASTWTQKNDSVDGILLTGRNAGEIFYYKSIYTGYNEPIEMNINHSLNDGAEFISHSVDTTVTGIRLWYMSPRLFKGPSEGEFYLVSWWAPAIFKVFHTNDFGQSFTLQYEQEIPEYCHFLYFNAGRGEGEFYITIYQPLCMCSPVYARFTLLHSNDYAKTFSEYYHEMTPIYNGEPASVIHTIAADIEPNDGGIVEGAGKYPEGDEILLIAEPSGNFVFSNWSENGVVLSEELELTITADKTRRIVANFEVYSNVSSNMDKYDVMLYPNPSNTLITIKLPNASCFDDSFIEIYNIQGQKVANFPLPTSHTILDISSLRAGIYTYRIKRNNRYLKSGKLSIVKRAG